MSYKQRYGYSSINRHGTPADKTRCCEEVTVYDNGWPRSHQCRRKRGHGPNGEYCKQHSPETVEERKKAAQVKYDQQLYEWRLRACAKRFHDALRKIADGDNDPRATAIEALKAMEK